MDSVLNYPTDSSHQIKMREYLFLGLIGLFVGACSVNYDIPPSSVTEAERIIVNSYLNPSDSIRVRLHKLTHSEKGYAIHALTGAHIVLKENDAVLFDAVCTDSVLLLPKHPQAGASYSIEVTYSDWPKARARTRVPSSIRCTAAYSPDGYRNLIRLTSFDIAWCEEESLWITAYRQRQDTVVDQYPDLYANNGLIDMVNRQVGTRMINEQVGAMYHIGFLRIKHKNLASLTELVFAPVYASSGRDTVRRPEPDKIRVKLITATPEYDRYNKTLYEQKTMIITEDDISSVFYKPQPVSGNVQQGLGIFAGINEENYVFQLPERERIWP